jgi:hypothetical protein
MILDQVQSSSIAIILYNELSSFQSTELSALWQACGLPVAIFAMNLLLVL